MIKVTLPGPIRPVAVNENLTDFEIMKKLFCPGGKAPSFEGMDLWEDASCLRIYVIESMRSEIEKWKCNTTLLLAWACLIYGKMSSALQCLSSPNVAPFRSPWVGPLKSTG